ncbi:MAG: hypothetical protein LBB80_01615 [Treponema sp.]|nr:hypothetical protein [Treponema sp.]
MKGAAAAGIRFMLIFGGKQGIEVEVRRDGRKGGFIRAGRFPVEPLIELFDETREGGVGLFHKGTTVHCEPDGKAALQGLPQAFKAPFGRRE